MSQQDVEKILDAINLTERVAVVETQTKAHNDWLHEIAATGKETLQELKDHVLTEAKTQNKVLVWVIVTLLAVVGQAVMLFLR